MSLFGPTLAGSAGQGPSADLGDTIDQSLRFRGSQTLTRTFSGNCSAVRTVSFWVKRALDEGTAFAAQHFFCVGSLSSVEFDDLSGNFSSGTSAAIGVYDGLAHHFNTGVSYRDPTAWYHVVTQFNGTSTKQWVNGTNLFSKTLTQRVANDITIGAYSGGTFPFKGYAANIHFIDGQALEPTDFGRYQEDGVWVPKDYTGSYGTNGFHLTFNSSQTNGIGHDSSGNGNHFTATGFDTGDVALYSAQLYTSTNSSLDVNSTDKNFHASGPATASFDGSTSSGSFPSGSDTALVFRPNSAITGVTSLRIYSAGNMGSGSFAGYNGTNIITNPTNGWHTLYSGSATTVNNVYITSTGSASFAAIEVNGTILVDNTDNDVDYFDTPTSNYATFNPSYPYPTASLSKANLRVDDSNGAYAPQTVASIKLDGKCYWEVIPTVVSSYPYVGVTILDPTLSSNEVFQQSLYVAADGGGGNFAVSISNNSFSTGTVLGFAYDSSNRQLTVTYDGTNSQTFTASGTAELAPMVAAAVNAGADVNYGQMPFLYTPPTGFSALQTNNLPEPTIKDGSDHFQAITAAGSAGGLLYAENAAPGGGGITPALAPLGTLIQPVVSGSAYTPTGTNPSGQYYSALSWIWDAGGVINNASITFFGASAAGQSFDLERSEDGQTFTFVRNFTGANSTQNISGANFRYVRFRALNTNMAGSQNFQSSQGLPILSVAQAAFSNGLWWVKDRQNSNNHQLVSSEYSGVIGCPTVGSYQSNFPAYAAPSGNSVAWCWGTDATGLNKEAGFEIIQQLGTLTYTTVNHRLEKEPKMIIAFAGRGDLALTMYHASLGPNYRATMSSALQFYNEPAWWGGDPTDFTATTFGVGPTAYTNDNENFNGGMTYFVWTDIPGYSAFGDYVGNSSSDGPYIYTGFRPSMILYKCATTTGNWHFRDTTRSVYNPAEAALYANLQYVESTPGNSGNYVDILSNGFKIRNGDGDQNTSGQTYIWAAWAENPFGGEKQPPATAR